MMDTAGKLCIVRRYDTISTLQTAVRQISDEFKLEVSTGTGKKIVMKFKNDETGYNGRAIPDGSIVELAF